MKRYLHFSLTLCLLLFATMANAWKLTVGTPAEGNVDKIEVIELLMPDGMETYQGSYMLDLTGPDGKKTYYFDCSNFGYKKLVSNPAINATTPGTYTLTVPAGLITNYPSGEPCEAMTFTWTIGSAAPSTDGTEANPYILTTEGVAGPKAATSYNDYTYYRYTATETVVVTLSHTFTSDAIGAVSINGTQVRSNPNGGSWIMNEGDVMDVKVACETAQTSQIIKVSTRAAAEGETKETAKTLNTGSNTIARVDNGAISNWYKLVVPSKKMATVTFPTLPAGYIYQGENKTAIGSDPFSYTNTSSAAETVYFEITATNDQTLSASVAMKDASAAPVSKIGALAFSVVDGKVPVGTNSVTVTFPNAVGGNASTAVTMEAYIFEIENGYTTGAPLNLSNNTYTGTLGNGVAVSYNFQDKKEYRIQVGNVTAGTYSAPNQDDHEFVDCDFVVGEKQNVVATTVNLTAASNNGVVSPGTVSSLNTTFVITAAQAGLNALGTVKPQVSLSSYPGWTPSFTPYLESVDGTTIEVRFGGDFHNATSYEGEWTVTFPEGALVSADGTLKNAEATFTWTVGSSATYTAPQVVSATNNGNASGSTVNSLSNTFVLTFDQDIVKGFNAGPVALNKNGNPDWDAEFTVTITGDKEATIVVSNTDLSANATYSLETRYGGFANAHNSDLVYAGGDTFTWTVSATSPTTDWTYNVTPANGSTVDAISHVYVEFPNLSQVIFMPAMGGPGAEETTPVVSLKNTTTGDVYTPTATSNKFDNDNLQYIENVLDFSFDAIPAGTYSFSVAANHIFTFVNNAPEYLQDDITGITFTSTKNAERLTSIDLNAACTDGEKYYSTFSASIPVYVGEDLEAYEISVDNDGVMTLVPYSAYETIPANTGVLMASTVAGEHGIYEAYGEGESKLGANNCLRPYTEAMSADKNNYRLTMHNGETIGFFWGAENGGVFDIAVNRAYLAVPKTVTAKGLWFNGNTATGINTIDVENASAIYNLAGQRVNKAAKGIVIMNGKKVVIK